MIKKLGFTNFLMLLLCFVIIVLSEYLFLTGNESHGLFLGLWPPTILGIVIFIKLVKNERK